MSVCFWKDLVFMRGLEEEWPLISSFFLGGGGWVVRRNDLVVWAGERNDLYFGVVVGRRYLNTLVLYGETGRNDLGFFYGLGRGMTLVGGGGGENNLVFMCGFGRGMTLFFCPANSYAEKVVRERFARAVARGLTELKIKKPTQSPINGLIQNAVIEVQISPILFIIILPSTFLNFFHRVYIIYQWTDKRNV